MSDAQAMEGPVQGMRSELGPDKWEGSEKAERK